MNGGRPRGTQEHAARDQPGDRRALCAGRSARVESVGDNRLGGWVSYRASKAALNQIGRTGAIGVARTRPLAVIAALHPGTVATGLISERGAIGLAWKIMAPFCLSEEEGAKTPLFAALDPSWAALTGKYLKKCAVERTNPCSADAPLRDAVEVAKRELIAETVGAQAG